MRMDELKQPVIVTGGAGFIGSHLVDALIGQGRTVHVFDDFSRGSPTNLSRHAGKPGFHFHKVDITDYDALRKEVRRLDPMPSTVFHLAAFVMANIGADEARTHWKSNAEGTYNLLEVMRHDKRIDGRLKLVFSSTGAVYGDATLVPTPEDYGPLHPISLYAASKLACEGLLSSYCDNYSWSSLIFRFANVIGSRENHGVIPDFIKKLSNNKFELEILGDGSQSKSYLHVSDCVSAMLFTESHASNGTATFNLGTKDRTSVNTIADIVMQESGLNSMQVKRNYTGGRAWAGDVKLMQLEVSKLASMGWTPRLNSTESVRIATKEILGARK